MARAQELLSKRQKQAPVKRNQGHVKSKNKYKLTDPLFQRHNICKARKTRKEVLHAYRKTGQSGQRKPRNNQFRNITC